MKIGKRHRGYVNVGSTPGDSVSRLLPVPDIRHCIVASRAQYKLEKMQRKVAPEIRAKLIKKNIAFRKRKYMLMGKGRCAATGKKHSSVIAYHAGTEFFCLAHREEAVTAKRKWNDKKYGKAN